MEFKLNKIEDWQNVVNEILPKLQHPILLLKGNLGAGKTTLIKTILGEIEPISGKVIVGSKVKMGYISQNTLLEGNNSVIEYLTENMVNVNYSLVFTLLEKIGKFGSTYTSRDLDAFSFIHFFSANV